MRWTARPATLSQWRSDVSPAYPADYREIKAVLQANNDETVQPVVTLYGRPGCGLCEEAARWLRRWAGDLRFRLDEVDLDRDAALRLEYDWFVPVIKAGELELARAPLDRTALYRRLRGLLAG
jgi:glutaredoxin